MQDKTGKLKKYGAVYTTIALIHAVRTPQTAASDANEIQSEY